MQLIQLHQPKSNRFKPFFLILKVQISSIRDGKNTLHIACLDHINICLQLRIYLPVVNVYKLKGSICDLLLLLL